MDDVIYMPTVVVGVIITSFYLSKCHREQQKIDLLVVVNLFTCAGGTASGAFLMLSTFVPELRQKLASLDFYIFLSGLVMMFVSGQGIYDAVRRK